MNKEVIINISGLQLDAGTEEPIELMTTGDYYLKNGKHYVIYDELTDDSQVVKNRLKISPKIVEVTKKGASSSIWYLSGEKKTSLIMTLLSEVFCLGLTQARSTLRRKRTVWRCTLTTDCPSTQIMFQTAPSTCPLRPNSRKTEIAQTVPSRIPPRTSVGKMYIQIEPAERDQCARTKAGIPSFLLYKNKYTAAQKEEAV